MTVFEERFGRLTQVYDTLIADQKVRSKKDMAKQLGVTAPYLFSRLSGGAEVTEDFSAKLQRTFGISAKWLLFGTGPMRIAKLQKIDISPELEKLLRGMARDIKKLNQRVVKLERELAKVNEPVSVKSDGRRMR